MEHERFSLAQVFGPGRVAAMGGLAVVLAVIWTQNYLLFHTLAELFAIVVGFASFMVTWYARNWTGRNYLLLLGVGLAFVCLLDTLHAASYPGIGIFEVRRGMSGAFWLSARALEASVFLVAVSTPQRRWRPAVLVAVLGGVAALALGAIFGGFFPATYELARGVTPFKTGAEVVIIVVFSSVLWRLHGLRREFDPRIYPLLFLCVAAKILTEVPFLSYQDITGWLHLVGHLLKILGMWLFLMAVVEPALQRPHALIFGALEREKGLSDALMRHAATLNAVLEATVDPVMLMAADLRIHFINRAAEGIFGRTMQETEGRSWRELGLPAALMEPLEQLCRDVLETGEPLTCELRLPERLGCTAMEAQISAVQGENGPDGVVLMLRDISARKAMEDDLQASLRDKKALMSEVHHRVKNNLQIVSSLLQMQGWRVSDPALRVHLDEACGRILTLAKAHELLYQQDSVSAVDFLLYLRTLCADMFRFHGIVEGRISLEIQEGCLPLPVDKAEPLALIAHELVGSALKQAFTEGGGTLRVWLDRVEADWCVLTVADDGNPGRSMRFQGDDASLGLRMVDVLVRQLNGTASVRQIAGTVVEIRFPVSV